jgi:D-alanyl-D-alanine carboxypeptidase
MKWIFSSDIALFLFVILVGSFSACQKEPALSTSACEEVPPYREDHPKAEALQQTLDKYVNKGLPGIVVLIRDGEGRWIGSAGQADLSENTPMQLCQVSKVASITKPFIATLIFQLVEDSVIKLDEKAGQWVKSGILARVNNGGAITIRQLLNHSSGVYDVVSDQDFYLSVLNEPRKEWKSEELLEYVYHEPAYFPAGDSTRYSNTNYILLSRVIEAATGKSHAQLLRERIFKPLGLEHTSYHWHDPLPSSTAQGYYDLYNNGDIMNLTMYNTGDGNGYNGIYSTVADLQRFIEALVRDKTLLKPATVDQMLTFQPYNDDGKKFGLGIYKDFIGHPANTYAYGHRGRELAYSGDMFWFPQEDVTFVTLVNYGTNAESKLQSVYFDYREEVVSRLLE